jgi:hypothetical protein
MSKKKNPSKAQARKLAWLWGTDKFVIVNGITGSWVDPTVRVLLKYGWLQPCGASTASHQAYEISEAGLCALEMHLFAARIKRPARSEGKPQA